jgi:hypothetical protein
MAYILGDFFTNSSGVDVMIKIFCDFPQFSAKKLAFFSKFSFVLSPKRHLFAKFFGENILKIITSVPGPLGCEFPTYFGGIARNATAVPTAH